MCSLETPAKYLISKYFTERSLFLWITLLIYRCGGRQSLENQGFGRNAQKKSKFQNLYKSSTYVRYGFCSAFPPIGGGRNPRLPNFVHKCKMSSQVRVQKVVRKLCPHRP